MYVTRPISGYRRSPDALSLPPPEGPNSGVLVILDEETEAQTTCCFGLCKNILVNKLPIPQNKMINISYSSGSGDDSDDYVYMIPVINQPLSANRYYVIKADGKHAGEAHTCSTEEDVNICCFCTFIKDVKSRPLDPNNAYQQIEFDLAQGSCNTWVFQAKSVAPDGFPPYFLRRSGWSVYTRTAKYLKLEDAPGLDPALRSRLPDFHFPASHRSSEPVVVGKWYCPFTFIKDGTLKDQVKRSTYYPMTLEQRWEQVYGCENNTERSNVVTLDVIVQREAITVRAAKANKSDESRGENGVVWFRSSGDGGEVNAVGLHTAVIERMKWEQERFGWVGGDKREARLMKAEEFEGVGGWRRYNCYVLVESYVLKRMDGSLVMSYDFMHTNRMQSKWE